MHVFLPGMPIGAKQGVPDACFKIPSENPDHSYPFSSGVMVSVYRGKFEVKGQGVRALHIAARLKTENYTDVIFGFQSGCKM